MARTRDITPGCQALTRSCRVLATMALYDLYSWTGYPALGGSL